MTLQFLELKPLTQVSQKGIDTVTEDISVSWKLQTANWKLIYEPNALCDVLMPDTIKGLWRQRLRWAQGGFEVFCKYGKQVLFGRDLALKYIVLEYLFSVSWIFALPVVVMYKLTMQLNSTADAVNSMIFISGVISFIQYVIGCWLHRRYENKATMAYWTIWYPLAYWILNSLVLMYAIPKVIFGKKEDFKSWISPDRGGITYANMD